MSQPIGSPPGCRQARERRRQATRWLIAAAISGVVLGPGASAGVADDCANAQFRTGSSARLPDCRAYEQVSPVNKRGNKVILDATSPNPGWSSAAGDTILFNVAGGPATDGAARGFSFPQVAERTASGWSNRAAANGPAPQAPVDSQRSTLRFQIPSADREDLLFSSGSPFTADNPYVNAGGNGSVNLARGSSVDWLSKPTWAGSSPAPGDAELNLDLVTPAGASKDLSTSYFMSRATLTPEDGASGRLPDLTAGSVPTPGSSWALYRWKEGVLSNAGVLPPGSGYPDGLDPGGSAAAGLSPSSVGSTSGGNLAQSASYSYTHSVSPDGDGVLFVSPDPKAETGRPSQLYLARDGQATIQLSKRTDASSAPPGTAGVAPAGGINASSQQDNASSSGSVYAVASRDQQVVVFSTTDALTDDAPASTSIIKSYRYTVAGGGALTYLPDFDRPADGANGMTFNMSDDGSRILYRTSGDVLKLWRDGMPPLTLSSGVAGTSAQGSDAVGISESRFSTDGRTLVLMSRVPLGGETNHPSASGIEAPSQVYRYTEANTQIHCVSCPPPTVSPRAPSAFTLVGIDNGFGFLTNTLTLEPNRGMTDDGKAVFFTTTSPLSDDDHNAVADVYEWRDGDGAPKLLSSGDAASAGELFVDNSASGSDVFFISQRVLVNADTDDVYDLYDARVGGGLPDPKIEDPGCVLNACQGPPTAPPSVLDPASPLVGPVTTGQQDVPGNVKAVEPLKITRKQASATQVTLAVRTPGAGKLRASGRGLRTVSRTAKRAASYTLKAKLSSASRQTLRKKGRLSVRVSVRFTPTKGKAVTKAATLTIKRKAR